MYRASPTRARLVPPAGNRESLFPGGREARAGNRYFFSLSPPASLQQLLGGEEAESWTFSPSPEEADKSSIQIQKQHG